GHRQRRDAIPPLTQRYLDPPFLLLSASEDQFQLRRSLRRQQGQRTRLEGQRLVYSRTVQCRRHELDLRLLDELAEMTHGNREVHAGALDPGHDDAHDLAAAIEYGAAGVAGVQFDIQLNPVQLRVLLAE